MSEQGARGEGQDGKDDERGGERGGARDDWWTQLYDVTASDTGRARAPDTLDDRFASVARTLAPRRAPAPRRPADPEVPEALGEPDEPSRPDERIEPNERDEPVEPNESHEPDRLVEPNEPDALAQPDEPDELDEPDEDGEFPPADPATLAELVADVALDGGRHGELTVRAASVRGVGARRTGAPRGDALLTARFGAGDSALLLVAVATGAPDGPRAHRAAREACHSIGAAVGRSHARLAEDIRAGRRGALKSGLHRLTDRTLGKLRAQAAALSLEPERYTAGLRCLLLSADPRCRTRIFFAAGAGAGAGGLFRLRDGHWHDIEPGYTRAQPLREGAAPAQAAGPGAVSVPAAGPPGPGPGPGPAPAPPEDPIARAAAARDGFTAEPPDPALAEPFRFRASVARPGDVLLVCGPGLAAPLREEHAFTEDLARRWTARAAAPGLAAYLADIRKPLTGHDLDRTAVTVWETPARGVRGAVRGSAPGLRDGAAGPDG